MISRYYPTDLPVKLQADVLSKIPQAKYEEPADVQLLRWYLMCLDGNIINTAEKGLLGRQARRLIEMGYIIAPKVTLTTSDGLQEAPVRITNIRYSNGHMISTTTIDLRSVTNLPPQLSSIDTVSIRHNQGIITNYDFASCTIKDNPSNFISSLQLATLANCLTGAQV